MEDSTSVRVVNEHQTKFAFSDLIKHLGWSFGDHTYGVPLVYAQGKEKLIIGKYCSIGGDVTIVLAGHRPDYVSTYPFVVQRKSWNVPEGASDHKGKGDIVIGNDVWIGHGAHIASGVTIGDGAVIAAAAVVTKDVAPYAIVGGSPAKLIKYRFNEEKIEKLLQIKWWNWSDEKVEASLPYILSDNIDKFIEFACKSV